MVLRTPLFEMQSAQGASFGLHHSWEIPEHYGQPRNEYEAIRREVGAVDLCHCGKLRVTGRDRVRFLHNMLSNDIRNLKEGTGCYATLLTHQGRMESDLYVYASVEELWLECSAAGKDRVFETLNRYIIADVVQIEDCTEKLGILSLQGPGAREKMELTVQASLEGLAFLEHRVISHPFGDWVVVHRDRSGCDGYDLWLPVADAAEVWRRWSEGERIRQVGYQALDWLRTEAGIPWYGVDMDTNTLPMEVGLDSALSMTKGCYRGQEIVARVTHRGHLDRRLGGIAVEHAEPPSRGAEVRAEGTRIGVVTSAIPSPILERPLALAILKTDFLRPGVKVDVVYGETAFPGAIVALPLRPHV